MGKEWNYDDAYKRHPIEEGEKAVWENGSTVMINNIFDEVPSEFREADIVFVDPPWNTGNLNSFYTKADRTDYPNGYDTFMPRVLHYIDTINPKIVYLEIGKEFLAEYIVELKKRYKYVTFYNSSYYHNKQNKCYVIRASRKAKKPALDYMDEEDIINWITHNEEYECICDFCIGRGLVAMGAADAGKRFVGGELNHKRLSVLLERVPGYQIEKR